MGVQRHEVDDATPFADQVGGDDGPVNLFLRWKVERSTQPEFLEAWRIETAFMKRQPGFIEVQMYEGLDESPYLMEVCVWESTADLRAATSQPEYRELLAKFPDCVSSPYLFRRVAVPGICLGEQGLAS